MLSDHGHIFKEANLHCHYGYFTTGNVFVCFRIKLQLAQYLRTSTSARWSIPGPGDCVRWHRDEFCSLSDTRQSATIQWNMQHLTHKGYQFFLKSKNVIFISPQNKIEGTYMVYSGVGWVWVLLSNLQFSKKAWFKFGEWIWFMLMRDYNQFLSLNVCTYTFFNRLFHSAIAACVVWCM